MGLEKAGPELLLRQVMRHIFTILLFHCKYNKGSYKYRVPAKGSDTLSHSREWDGVSKRMTGTVLNQIFNASDQQHKLYF